MRAFHIISGCSGGGKSTLLDALSQLGHSVVTEPGRRIVREERKTGGAALPWIDPIAFAERAIAMARDDLERAMTLADPVFFDRSAIDAAAYLATRRPDMDIAAIARDMPYHRTMFMAPPWPELFSQDEERQHDFQSAKAEYDNLCKVYPLLGFQIIPLPKASLEERVAFVLSQIHHKS